MAAVEAPTTMVAVDDQVDLVTHLLRALLKVILEVYQHLIHKIA